MYENGEKKGFNIDFPSFDISKFHKEKKEIIVKEEKNYRISGRVIPKMIAVFIFFFLFILCISRFGTIIDKNTVIDENDFNSDLTYIQEKAIAYYKKGRMPKVSGETSTLTFEELIKDGILDKNKIANFEDCILKESSIKLTLNHNKTYKIVVSLNCNGIIQQKEEILKKI